MKRALIALLLLVSGAALAVAKPAKQNTSAKAPHCAVGVISTLGEKFNVRKKFSLGSPIEESVPVGSWHIDDLVVDRFRAVLGKRAMVQRVPYRKDVEAEVGRSFGRSLFGASLFGAYSRELLRRLTAGTGCTRYVFVTPGPESMASEPELIGLGIRINTIFVHNAVVHAVVKLTIYDGETFSLLYSTTEASHRKVDEPFWPDSPSSAAQNATLREATRGALAQRLDTTIANLKGTIAP